MKEKSAAEPDLSAGDDGQLPARTNLLLFLGGILLLGITAGIYEATFNNFLHDTFDVTAEARGLLEFPREFPGFAVVFLTGLLFFLPETKIASLATLCVGLGMFGLAQWGSNWGMMVFFTVFWSAGVHVMMVMRSALSLGLARQQQQGRRLGQVQGVGIAAGIIGSGVVWVLFSWWKPDYPLTFRIGGVLAILGAVVLWHMRMPGGNLARPKFVVHRKYWLYYVLALLFGGRKQIFLTFAPWVLVQVYGQSASVMATLMVVSAVLGIFFQPFLGRLIDSWGERTILTLDSVVLAAVCLGYGLSHLAGDPALIVWLLYLCFVGDNLLFGVNMARTTYMTKIARRKEDISPTLSLGVTLDHAVSMVIPFFGGLLWAAYGYQAVFFAATGVAGLMFFFTRFLPPRRILNRIRFLNS